MVLERCQPHPPICSINAKLAEQLHMIMLYCIYFYSKVAPYIWIHPEICCTHVDAVRVRFVIIGLGICSREFFLRWGESSGFDISAADGNYAQNKQYALDKECVKNGDGSGLSKLHAHKIYGKEKTTLPETNCKQAEEEQ